MHYEKHSEHVKVPITCATTANTNILSHLCLYATVGDTWSKVVAFLHMTYNVNNCQGDKNGRCWIMSVERKVLGA